MFYAARTLQALVRGVLCRLAASRTLANVVAMRHVNDGLDTCDSEPDLPPGVSSPSRLSMSAMNLNGDLPPGVAIASYGQNAARVF